MGTQEIEETRIQRLNNCPVTRGDYVLYWMQQSQRAEENPALEYAIQQANELRQSLWVGFGLTDNYPEANLRHYSFMLQGLADVARALKRHGIKFVVQRGAPDQVAIRLGKRASLVVCDRGYLRHQRSWRSNVARSLNCPVVQIEGDVVVPIEEVSSKAEYAARTIRPKIHLLWGRYVDVLKPTKLRKPSLDLSVDSPDLRDERQRAAILDSLQLDRSVLPVGERFPGGTRAAKRIFRAFLRDRFSRYAVNRNQPQTDDVSHMSKYLHFGQISPVWLAAEAGSAVISLAEAKDTFIEELIVRRELSCNFVYYTKNYDRFACLPKWAKTSLAAHASDPRPYRYTKRQLDSASTHDPYWNAAMREMKYTGYMHNYMRMYWGKKILEWSNSPEHAFRVTLALNNRYFLDGRDPNSYAGVGWVFGLHDRPWFEREVTGSVRWMSIDGLKRKCEPDAYVAKVDELIKRGF